MCALLDRFSVIEEHPTDWIGFRAVIIPFKVLRESGLNTTHKRELYPDRSCKREWTPSVTKCHLYLAFQPPGVGMSPCPESKRRRNHRCLPQVILRYSHYIERVGVPHKHGTDALLRTPNSFGTSLD